MAFSQTLSFISFPKYYQLHPRTVPVENHSIISHSTLTRPTQHREPMFSPDFLIPSRTPLDHPAENSEKPSGIAMFSCAVTETPVTPTLPVSETGSAWGDKQLPVQKALTVECWDLNSVFMPLCWLIPN